MVQRGLAPHPIQICCRGEACADLPWRGAPAVSKGALVDLAGLGGRGLFFREPLWGVPAGRGAG